MAIIIPHQLSLAPPTCPPSRFQRTASQSTAVRFFVSISPLFCFQQSSLPFPSVCFLVPFVPYLRSFRSAPPFPLFRFFVSFGLLFRFLRSVSSFFWSVSTRHCVVARSFLFSSSLPFCQVFLSLSNPTHAFQRSRPCPSMFETTPFLPQEHALQRSRTRPSPPVYVSACFRVSCKSCFVSHPPPSVGVLVCVFVKTFHKAKSLVGCFVSHRV